MLAHLARHAAEGVEISCDCAIAAIEEDNSCTRIVPGDERLRAVPIFRRKLIRPELGAICGAIAVFLFFVIVAPESGMFSLQGLMNWGSVAAQFAIIAVGACLLMIAGEFDLSVGSMIGFSGIVIALLSTSAGLPMWLAILIAFALALAIGAVNGFLVIRTGLPSFIVTLASLFSLRGLTIYIPIKVNGTTIISGLEPPPKATGWRLSLAWRFSSSSALSSYGSMSCGRRERVSNTTANGLPSSAARPSFSSGRTSTI